MRVLDDYRRRFPWLWAAIEMDASPGQRAGVGQGQAWRWPKRKPIGQRCAHGMRENQRLCLRISQNPGPSASASRHSKRKPYSHACPAALLPCLPAAEFKLEDVLPDQEREQQLEQVGGLFLHVHDAWLVRAGWLGRVL